MSQTRNGPAHLFGSASHPKRWAHELSAKEASRCNLTKAQRDMWRAALGLPPNHQINQNDDVGDLVASGYQPIDE
jgi:hypothetical protein